MADNTIIVKLVSSENTGTFYTTTRNSRTTEKLALKKYDPKLRKHVMFNEKKIK